MYVLEHRINRNRIAAWAKHLTVANLLLMLLLVAVVSSVLLRLPQTKVRLPTVASSPAPKVSSVEKMFALQDYLIISDMNLFYQEALNTYLVRWLLSQPAAEPRETETVKSSLFDAISLQQDYQILAEQNLFHPERRIPVMKVEAPRPDFVLYGTLMSDTVRIAYLSDRKSVRKTPGRGERQNSLKLGESLGGYQLEEVHHDRIVMVRGDDRFEVKIADPAKKKERNAVKTALASDAETGVHHPPEQTMSVGKQPQPGPRAIIPRISPGRQSLAPSRRTQQFR